MTHRNYKYNALLERARGWCSRREMCKSEIRIRLQKTELSDEEINEIISVLVEEKFIDEKRFARAFVHDKIEYQKWGIQKVKYAMYYKEISQENIAEALENIDKEEYLEKFMLVAKLRKKTIKGVNDYEKKQKLMRFLLSKGIGSEDVFCILKRISEEKET